MAQLVKNPPAMQETGLIPGLGSSTGEGLGSLFQCSWASLVAQLVKNPPAMRETWVWSLGWEDPLEQGTATRVLENSMDCIVLGVTKSQIRLTFTHFQSIWRRGLQGPPTCSAALAKGFLQLCGERSPQGWTLVLGKKSSLQKRLLAAMQLPGPTLDSWFRMLDYSSFLGLLLR